MNKKIKLYTGKCKRCNKDIHALNFLCLYSKNNVIIKTTGFAYSESLCSNCRDELKLFLKGD